MTDSHKKSGKAAKTAVVIVAAGSGARAGGALPKQYQNLGGRAVIASTIEKFSRFGPIIIVAHPDYHAKIAIINQNVTCVNGGKSRTDSVKAGLLALADIAPKYVLIHDAARPLVSARIIDGVIEGLASHRAAAPTVPLVDAIKHVDGDSIGADAPRDKLVSVQTPQGFHYANIMDAYNALPDGAALSDDIAVARGAGLSIAMTAGHANNIKITYPEDFSRAETLMNSLITVTGSGYDVHRLIDGDHMFLCGVRIDGDKALLGHSDADVGLHAITDALFGAMAAGDIGDHFPPSDPQWKGAPSSQFLRAAYHYAIERGAQIDHVDVTLICEAPKIKPYRAAMRAHIAKLLDLDMSFVSVKATTTEGLGFTGRGEGIAAQAVVTIRRPLPL
ncbi:MAG: bifunctional 2-C-methyl-D-erythritol 4-phosphate cytidylyltransferase/2-C-methyl-D-erythritol 2,4-cyclodiphosphate synthase [Robiginitomaculum sp.]